MKKVLILVCAIFLSSCLNEQTNTRNEKDEFIFFFSGSEPYWSLKVGKSYYELFIGEKIIGKVTLSNKSQNGNTFGFSGDEIYGIVNQTWNESCQLSVYEEDSLGLEIFFSFDGKTFKGCGKEITESL